MKNTFDFFQDILLHNINQLVPVYMAGLGHSDHKYSDHSPDFGRDM